MLFLLILFAFCQLGLSVNPFIFRKYQKDCDAKIEDLPWQITNFVMFKKAPATNRTSYITFDFVDINDRLEIDTSCTRTVFPNSTIGLFSDEWFQCDNEDVRFMFDGEILQLSRHYTDKCLGPAPWNSAIAFGRIKPNATSTTAIDGIYGTKSEMHVPISSLA